MNLIFSFSALAILILIVVVGVEAANLKYIFGVIIPYAAFVMFMIGVIYKVIHWARSPVPSRSRLRASVTG